MMVLGLQRRFGMRIFVESDQFSSFPKSKKPYYAFHDLQRSQALRPWACHCVADMPTKRQTIATNTLEYHCSEREVDMGLFPRKVDDTVKENHQVCTKSLRGTYARVGEESPAATYCGALITLLRANMQVFHKVESKWP